MKRKHYKFVSLKTKLTLQTSKHELTLFFTEEHVTGIYRGQNAVTKAPMRGVLKTSIHTRLNRFERQAVAFYLLGKIRHGSIKEANETNYAEIFVSTFE